MAYTAAFTAWKIIRRHKSCVGTAVYKCFVMSDNIVLCYHALSPSWAADLSTTPERFERQIRFLLDRGYRPARFTEAVNAPGASRVVSITFDDAYRSVITLALPILARLGVPATVFAPTDYIGLEGPMRWPGIDMWLGGPSEDELTPMTWHELRSLVDAGWEIGSHSCSHPRLTGLDHAALREELTRSKAACEEHLSAGCSSIAYPYGDVDRRVSAAAADAGYTAGAALPSNLESHGPLEWPRVGIYHGDDDVRFRMKVSPALRRVRRSAAWGAVDVVRRLRRPQTA
jgi:peptidoglycan/xylan/chitin deacetylase (PgdA/CDA1 family)